jgi:squalene-hopene/tetraprenyl-beta-curcumene cyclase
MIRALFAFSFSGVLIAAEVPTRAEVTALLDQAQAWSVAQTQPDGGLLPGKTFRLGITAFVAGALVTAPAVDSPAITAAVAYVAKHRQPDGGVYDADEGLGCYGTSLALLLASRLPPAQAGAFDVPAMQRYLFGNQNTTAGSLGQGGIGYGDQGKGFEDLSNTGYALQALRASGIPAQDERMQAALQFLQRCQDLSTVNSQPWVTNSGGGVYGPQDATRSWAKGDESQAPRYTPSGTMTYELLSSYLVLDLKADDPRVAAAVQWVTAHYGFDANPGLKPEQSLQGLFHSYALAGSAFELLAQAHLTLPAGQTVDWRADLFAALRQRAQMATLANGQSGAFWINSAARWGEGLPHLCTGYAIRSLKAIAKSLP